MLGDPDQLQGQLQGEQQDGEAQHPVGGCQSLIAPELPQQQAYLQRDGPGEHHDPAVYVIRWQLRGGDGEQQEAGEGEERAEPAETVGFAPKEVAQPRS